MSETVDDTASLLGTDAEGAPRRGNAPVLELRGVTKYFESGGQIVRALDNVSLSVAPGELVAVMGPSGSGKSTLLHLAAALESQEVGQVLVAGRDLRTLQPAAMAATRRHDVGIVLQRYNLIPSLTALENVMLPLQVDDVSVADAEPLAREALARVGITDGVDRFPDSLSGGQQQRVAVARGIVGDRKLLLADEPTAALDTTTGDAIIELLASLPRRTGTAVVLVTHEPRYAAWADRVVFLRDGRIADQTDATA